VPPAVAPVAVTVQKPPPAGAVPAAGYASPIPVRRTHLGNALASEWTKIRSVRSTMWTLGVMFVLVLGIGTLTAASLSGDKYVGIPLLGGGLFGLMLGMVCVVTLGVLVVTSEYGTGMIRTTLTACPQRGRVLAAKAIIFFALAFTLTLIACTLTALIQDALLSGQTAPDHVFEDFMKDSIEGGTVVAHSGQWLGATVGAALYVATFGLLAVGVGALLRHTAGAITTMLGVMLLPLITAIFMQGDSLRTTREKLIEYSPLNGLASLFRMPIMGDMDGTGWPLLGILAAATAGVLLLAGALLSKRDV
jgi:hypothetical protein